MGIEGTSSKSPIRFSHILKDFSLPVESLEQEVKRDFLIETQHEKPDSRFISLLLHPNILALDKYVGDLLDVLYLLLI